MRPAGWRPLHFAAKRLDLDIFRVLVRAGAALNAVDVYGMSPLMTALAGQLDEVQENWQIRIVLVRELLEADVDMTLRDIQGWSAPHFAATLEDPEPMKMLVWKMPEAMKFLTKYGQSPLYVAAKHGRANTVSQLLAMRANQPTLHVAGCNCCTGPNSCPLRVAAFEGHVDVMHVLIDDVESIGGLEATIPSAMQVTCTSASDAYSASGKNQGRWTKILKVLLDVEGEDRQENWARSMFSHFPVLYHAVVSGTLATISLLLAAGADETVLNMKGQTASEAMDVPDIPFDARVTDPAENAATRSHAGAGPRVSSAIVGVASC